MDIDLSKLRDPFTDADVDWRLQSSGFTNDRPWAIAVPYVTGRAIQDRLDEVCGPENWQNEYREWHGQSQLCGISIRIGGEWITKWDGADDTQIESTKGGLSGALKRAAVHWGIGRHLYNLDIDFVECSTEKKKGWEKAYNKEARRPFWWKPPLLSERGQVDAPEEPKTPKDLYKASVEKIRALETLTQCRTARERILDAHEAGKYNDDQLRSLIGELHRRSLAVSMDAGELDQISGQIGMDKNDGTLVPEVATELLRTLNARWQEIEPADAKVPA